MPNIPPGKALANFLVSEDLEKRVRNHRNAFDLDTMTAAYTDLIERGLKDAAKEKAPESK